MRWDNWPPAMHDTPTGRLDARPESAYPPRTEFEALPQAGPFPFEITTRAPSDRGAKTRG